MSDARADEVFYAFANVATTARAAAAEPTHGGGGEITAGSTLVLDTFALTHAVESLIGRPPSTATVQVRL